MGDTTVHIAAPPEEHRTPSPALECGIPVGRADESEVMNGAKILMMRRGTTGSVVAVSLGPPPANDSSCCLAARSAARPTSDR